MRGAGWRTHYHKSLLISGGKLDVIDADGRGEPWQRINGVWQGDADSDIQLVEDATGFSLIRDNAHTERYNLQGQIESESTPNQLTTTYSYDCSSRLQTVTGPWGHALAFIYNGDDQIEQITLGSGGPVFQYHYDTQGNLASVTYPSAT